MAALLAFLVFLPSLAGGFVYDDGTLIESNPHVHTLGGAGRAFRTHFFDTGGGASSLEGRLAYYRPLVTVSYAVSWVMGKGAPWAFHAGNAVLHALAVALVTRAALRWTRSTGWALAVGLCLGVHPTRADAVAWVSGRTDLLLAVFGFAALSLAAGAVRQRGPRGTVLEGSANLAFAASVLSKETALGLLPLFAVEGLTAPEGPGRVRAFRILATNAAVSAIYLVGRSLYLPARIAGAPDVPSGLVTTGAYVERVLFPWPGTAFYRPLECAANGAPILPTLPLLLGALTVTGGAVLAIVAWRRDRVAALILAASAFSIAPATNFLATGLRLTVADRFLYLPLPLCLVAVARLWPNSALAPPSRRLAYLCFGGLAAVWAMLSLIRTFDYRDTFAFFGRELELRPDNPVALRWLGAAHSHNGDVELAYAMYGRSIEPGTRRYCSLNDGVMVAQTYFRLLGLRASLLADGDVANLRAILGEMSALVDGRVERTRARVIDLEMGLPIRPDVLAGALSSMRPLLIADALFVAARLGQDEPARRFLSKLTDRDLAAVPNVPNVVLSAIRMHDFDGARRVTAAAHGAGIVSSDESDALGRRTRDAEARWEAARTRAAPEDSLGRALVLADVGAYLRALGELRAVHEHEPRTPRVAEAYVQLLVAARLEGEARRELQRHLAPEIAEATVREIRALLSPRLQHLPAPQEPIPWNDVPRP